MSNKKRKQQVVFWIIRLMTLGVVGVLCWILGFLIVKGAGAISWEFLTGYPSGE
jgi:phosphate transport system permease protein